MANFERYRSFVAIYRSGSVTAAAALRHMTQPALSQHLAALEAEAGGPLFVRYPRRMVPTERGVALYNQVAPAVDRLERVTSELRGGVAETVIRLGAPLEYFTERLPPRLGPDGERVVASFGTAEGLLDALEGHELDVVVATQHLPRRGVLFLHLEREFFWLVGGPDAAGCSGPPEEVRSALEAMPWISYGPDLPIIRRFWREAFGERPAIAPRFIVPNLHAISAMVQRSAGVSVLPSYLAAPVVARGAMRRLWAPPRPVQNDIWLAYRAPDRNDAAISRFVNRIVTEAGDGGEPTGTP